MVLTGLPRPPRHSRHSRHSRTSRRSARYLTLCPSPSEFALTRVLPPPIVRCLHYQARQALCHNFISTLPTSHRPPSRIRPHHPHLSGPLDVLCRWGVCRYRAGGAQGTARWIRATHCGGLLCSPTIMLEQHSTHVFALSSSPHRRHSQTPAQAPRSILKKSSSEPSSPSSSSPPLSPRPTMSSVSYAEYQPHQWSVAGITRAQSSNSSTSSASSSAPGNRLTVTLLYTPTDTLFAWPFNMSSPGARGVCYETLYSDKETGAVRRPPEGAMSTSLRVLADVIRCWIRIRRDRSSVSRAGGADAAYASASASPTSSIDALVDNDEVVDQIIEDLGMAQLTPFERSIHLLRQVLPDQLSEEPTSPTRAPSEAGSSQVSDDDRDSRHRSDSASSRASTLESTADEVAPAQKASPNCPPKLTIALPKSQQGSPKAEVPQIKLVEATPQEGEYEERDRALERAALARSRKNSPGGMQTVLEAEDEDKAATEVDEEGAVTYIEVVPVDPPSPSIKSQPASPGKPKVTFRDPFKSIQPGQTEPRRCSPTSQHPQARAPCVFPSGHRSIASVHASRVVPSRSNTMLHSPESLPVLSPTAAGGAGGRDEERDLFGDFRCRFFRWSAAGCCRCCALCSERLFEAE